MDTKDVVLLSAYLDDELAADERLQFEQRLKTDSQLQAELEELRQTVDHIRQMPLLKAPRNYTLNPADFQRPKRPFIYQLRPVLAVAAMLVIVFGAVFFFMNQQDKSSTQNQEIAAAPTQLSITDSPQPTFVMQATNTATALPTILPQTAEELNREMEGETGTVMEEKSGDDAEDAELVPPAPGAVEAQPTADLFSIPSGGGGMVKETPLDDTFEYAAESAAVAPEQEQLSALVQQIQFFIQQLIQFIRQLL
ncbi:MAG: hypothetical protein K8I82_03155 [Anaerolineae bacterium]|nr:hypothetical protein [Anaerolineae bacterium]